MPDSGTFLLSELQDLKSNARYTMHKSGNAQHRPIDDEAGLRPVSATGRNKQVHQLGCLGLLEVINVSDI